MRILIVLILIFISFNCFSQKDIYSNQKDSCVLYSDTIKIINRNDIQISMYKDVIIVDSIQIKTILKKEDEEFKIKKELK